MIIKIDTDAGDYKGIPVVIDGETVGHIADASELLKKMLQLLEDEQEKDDWDEIEREKEEWFGDD